MNEYKIFNNVKIDINTSLFLQKKIIKNFFNISKYENNENNKDKIFLFQTYSWSFGHILIACLLNYCVFLNNYDKFKDYKFSNIIKNKHNHISNLIEILSLIEQKKIYNLYDGEYYFNKVVHENLKIDRKLFPSTSFNKAKIKIKKYIFQKNDNYPKKIAIIKTSDYLDGKNKNNRCFNKNKIINICKNTNFILLDHYNMHLKDILNYIYNCDKLLVSWGATAYYSIFLEKHQKCICFSSNEYKSEIKNEWICLSSKLYTYKLIKKTFNIDLPDNECIYLQNEIV